MGAHLHRPRGARVRARPAQLKLSRGARFVRVGFARDGSIAFVLCTTRLIPPCYHSIPVPLSRECFLAGRVTAGAPRCRFRVVCPRNIDRGPGKFHLCAEVQVHVTAHVDSEQQGELAAVTVNPGNILVVGDSGVMCVPKLIKKDVLRVASQGSSDDIQSNVGVTESFRSHWVNCE
jgi:hypothetical protein